MFSDPNTTSGITTCAGHHIAQAAASFELKKDILSLNRHLSLGFELDREVVAKAAENHRKYRG